MSKAAHTFDGSKFAALGRIEQTSSTDGFAAAHYFLALTKCCFQSRVCLDALEIRTTLFNDHDAAELFHPQLYGRNDRLWRQRTAAYSFHIFTELYVLTAGYAGLQDRATSACHSCRGRNHVWNAPLVGGHRVSGSSCNFAPFPLPQLLPAGFKANSRPHPYSYSPGPDVYKRCI